MTEKKKYPTQHIYLSQELKDKLHNYVRQKFGNHKAISIVVQRAIQEYLQRQDF